MFVMLKFPEGNPLTASDLVARRALCSQAQRQCDAGEDITVPAGVEIICVADTAFLPQRAAA